MLIQIHETILMNIYINIVVPEPKDNVMCVNRTQPKKCHNNTTLLIYVKYIILEV